MAKSYSEMTPAARIRDRVAKNRRFEESVVSQKAGLSLDGIINHVNAHRQHATYKAVAELVGVLPTSLMSGRPKTPKYYCVVAASSDTDSQRGFPTGYSVNKMHPDCYRQIYDGV